MSRPYLYAFNKTLSNREIGNNSYVANVDKNFTVIAPKQVTARLIAGITAPDRTIEQVAGEVRKQIDNYCLIENSKK